MGSIPKLLGTVAPFLGLGGLVAYVVWGRLSGGVRWRLPRRSTFGDLGSGWKELPPGGSG